VRSAEFTPKFQENAGNLAGWIAFARVGSHLLAFARITAVGSRIAYLPPESTSLSRKRDGYWPNRFIRFEIGLRSADFGAKRGENRFVRFGTVYGGAAQTDLDVPFLSISGTARGCARPTIWKVPVAFVRLYSALFAFLWGDFFREDGVRGADSGEVAAYAAYWAFKNARKTA
jgi:hypothetical protein